MITPDNITQHELIGLVVTVVQSTNSDMVGMTGSIIHETKNTILVETTQGCKCIPKSINTLQFTNDTLDVTIPGVKIQKRPFDRIGRR